LTSTLHTDPRSLERAGFLLIIANIAHKRKMYECAYTYIYIYRYTIYVSHSSPSRKRAPAFSSARVYIFRGKIFRNYPSLLYPRASYCVQPQKPNIKLGPARRSGTHASGGREKEAISVRGCSPSAHAFMFSEFIFNRAFLFHLSLSLFLSRSLPLNLREEDETEAKKSIQQREKGTSIRQHR
jgi:hypothetical protein